MQGCAAEHALQPGARSPCCSPNDILAHFHPHRPPPRPPSSQRRQGRLLEDGDCLHHHGPRRARAVRRSARSQARVKGLLSCAAATAAAPPDWAGLSGRQPPPAHAPPATLYPSLLLPFASIAALLLSDGGRACEARRGLGPHGGRPFSGHPSFSVCGACEPAALPPPPVSHTTQTHWDTRRNWHQRLQQLAS